MMKYAPLLLLALGACATPSRPLEVKTQIVEVEVPTACPNRKEYDRLKKLRPAPLRETNAPTTRAERVAKIVGQLGLYEARGGYVDQVNAALDRCQQP